MTCPWLHRRGRLEKAFALFKYRKEKRKNKPQGNTYLLSPSCRWVLPHWQEKSHPDSSLQTHSDSRSGHCACSSLCWAVEGTGRPWLLSHSCCLTSSILLPAPSLPTCLSQSAPPERASLACPLSHPPSLSPCWTALQALIAPHSPAFSPRKAHIPRFCALTCAWHIAGPQCINVYQTNKCSPGGSHTQSHIPLCVPIPTWYIIHDYLCIFENKKIFLASSNRSELELLVLLHIFLMAAKLEPFLTSS